MKNPVAHDKAKAAARAAGKEQGGSVPEGAGRSHFKGQQPKQGTGHTSAKSAGVAGHENPGRG